VARRSGAMAKVVSGVVQWSHDGGGGRRGTMKAWRRRPLAGCGVGRKAEESASGLLGRAPAGEVWTAGGGLRGWIRERVREK
jgi:hypothetical protein